MLVLPSDNTIRVLGISANEVKLRSSMTLFAALPSVDPSYSNLDKYFPSQPDPHSLRLLTFPASTKP